LVALEVDVRGSARDGIVQDPVDQLDDGRLLDLHLEGTLADVLLFLLDQLDLAVDVELLEEVLHPLVGEIVLALDHLAESELARDDRLDIEAGDELEVVDRADVGRVAEGYRERATDTTERN